MKRIFFTLLAVSLFTSCHDRELYVDTDETSLMSNEEDSPLLYSNPLLTDWENMDEVTLTSGITVALPWANDVAGNFPDEAINHLNSDFGWELIVATVGTADVGLNYMLFRNLYTGMVRVFYYMEQDVTDSNTRTFWRLNFQGISSLVNSSGIFYVPSSYKQSFSNIEVSNLVLHESVNSIKRGWNCFEAEVNYDPDIQTNGVVFSIGSYNTTTSTLVVHGDYDSQSTGTIIRNNSSNPVQDTIVNTFGKTAKEWVEGSIGEESNTSKPIKIGLNIVGTIVQEGVKAIVGSGISSLFGSFIGIFKKDEPEVHELSFTTTGQVQLLGELTNIGGNNAVDWNNISATPIGVWAIEGTPEIHVGQYGLYRGMPPVDGFYELEKRYQLDMNTINVVLNEELQDKISRYSISTRLYYYDKLNGHDNWRQDYTGLVPIENTNENGILPQQQVLYESDNNVIKDAGVCHGQCEVYRTTIPPTGPFVWLNQGISEKFVVKVQLSMETNDGNEIRLSRTLIPKIKLVDNSTNPFSINTKTVADLKEDDKRIKVSFK